MPQFERISVRPLVAATILVVACCVPLAADEAWLKDALAKPIISPDTAQTEVENYCDARIPRMPAVATRAEWEAKAKEIREAMLSKIVLRGEAARWDQLPTHIVWLDTIDGGEGYRIKKLRYEAVPGMWIPALLYEPTKLEGKVPVAMNVNGHDGNGKAADYKQLRCINQAKRGMLVLNVEWLGMGQLKGEGFSHARMNQLDLVGTSGLAPFYLSMKRGLDVLLSQPNADPKRVAVSGLSGGGWQTIYISSLDTRVTLSNPVAGYSSFITRAHHHSDLGDSEQTPSDMATVADYTHLTAMLAPRPALLTYNIKDQCCFASGHALPPLLEAATPIYKLLEKEAHLKSHVNHDPGTHNFEQDNRQALYRMLSEHFFPGQNVSADEIESKAELKTAEQLTVELPAENANFQTLATKLLNALPEREKPPGESGAAEAWRQQQREKLKAIIRAQDMQVVAEKVDSSESDGVTATRWRLRIGDSWTVPAVEFSKADSKGTTILVADDGRSGLHAAVTETLASGQGVLAVDPFYLGESQIKSRAYLFSLLVSTVGDRTTGLQTSQITAVARWIKSQRADEPVTLESRGERIGLAALNAAALESKIDKAVLRGSLASLKQVIEKKYAVDQKPEFFCFGLLEQFDVDTIAALVAPRDLRREE